MKYRCPICQQNLYLSDSEKQLVCDNNHQFDRAKQGYFNLLPVQKKKSKVPGDSKEMINARETFLAGDFYLPLAEKLASIIDEKISNIDKPSLLDVGCGEGYYSRVIANSLTNNTCFYGFDIAKPAVQKAAKKHKPGNYSVASSEDIPLQDGSIDLGFKVYAPVNENELNRIIKSKGIFVNVTPAPRHLWQLRAFIYDNVEPHDTGDTTFEGFEKISNQQFSYAITPCSENRLNLLQMTPFAWKANESIIEKIIKADDLSIELDFFINIFQKIK